MAATEDKVSVMLARNVLLFLGVILPALAAGEWSLSAGDGGHSIATTNNAGERLVLMRAGSELEFLLMLAQEGSRPDVSQSHLVWIDGSERVPTALELVGRAGGKTFQLGLTGQQKITFMNQMIEGLTLGIAFKDQTQQTRTARFSLIGFTAAMNDFLIASEIGTLDLERLWEGHKERELLCYFTAATAVKAMLDRKGGRSQEECLAGMGRTGIDALNEAIPEIVARVYAVPHAQVPVDPRGDKYGIFKDCMARHAR